MDWWPLQRTFLWLWEDVCKLFSRLADNLNDVRKEAFVYFPRKLWGFFKRLWDYLPLIWNDNDFDYNYTITLIKFKLKRLRDHIIEHDFILHSKKYAKQIDKALADLERYHSLSGGNDLDRWIKETEAKYGPLIRYTECDIFNDRVPKRPYTTTFSKYDKETDKNKKEIYRFQTKMLNRQTREQERHWKKFWQQLEKNMRYWWD